MYKQLCSIGNLYLGEKATFLERSCHRVTFSLVSGEGVSIPWKHRENECLQECRRARVRIHTMHSSLVFLYFSTGALFSFSLLRLITYLEVSPHFGATVKMVPYISQYSHRQTHNFHQAWFLCLKPQENSPSWYKGLCDACILHRAVKWARFSFPALHLHKNHWKPLQDLTC